MRKLIHDEAGEQAIEGYVRKKSASLFMDGVRRVLDGSTSIEELLRVVTNEENN